jgi:hypothetical protein
MDYALECAQGRQAAQTAIDECRATGNYPKFTRTIRDMASQPGGVSIGFLQVIAERATE